MRGPMMRGFPPVWRHRTSDGVGFSIFGDSRAMSKIGSASCRHGGVVRGLAGSLVGRIRKTPAAGADADRLTGRSHAPGANQSRYDHSRDERQECANRDNAKNGAAPKIDGEHLPGKEAISQERIGPE